jgi:Na+-transporting methylmalonyl-CoA/oxaloacetate decarboxylase gamma subunit
MSQLLQNFIQTASTLQKAVFLMVSGILFVFLVQVVFYLIAKLWPRGKKEPQG